MECIVPGNGGPTRCWRGGSWQSMHLGGREGTPHNVAVTDRKIHTLRLSPELRDEMVIHLVRAAPDEGVGLLAVKRDAGIVEGTAFFPGENIDASPTRFTMHPRDVVNALDTMTKRGWTLGAIVHSHLKGPASPSRTDLGEAHYPDALMLIVSLAHVSPDMRAWRLDAVDDGVVARPITIVLAESSAAGDTRRP